MNTTLSNCLMGGLLALLLALPVHSAETDTLRHYRPGVQRVYFDDAAIAMQVLRFTPRAPGELTGLVCTLAGENAEGGARLRLFGHEGGTMVPALGEELCAARRIYKSRPGEERVVLHFDPPVKVHNNQFFVGLEISDPGVHLLSDKVPRLPDCRSESGDAFYVQYLQLHNGEWRSYPHAFEVDVLMRYTAPEPAGKLRDITLEAGFSDSLACSSIAWADVNGDTWPDVLTGQRLFLNRGDGSFRDASAFAGLDSSEGLRFFLDINADGAVDILSLPADAAAAAQVYRNEGGGVFSALQLSLPAIEGPTCFSIADFSGDGRPDIFIGADNAGAAGGFLLVAEGAAAFRDISDSLVSPGISTTAARASQWVDFDGDGDPDLYVGRDGALPDELWRNEGGLKFTRLLLEGDSRRTHYSRGGDWADFDNDGDPDLLLGRGMPDILSMTARPTFETGIIENLGAPDFHLRAAGYTPALELEEKHGGAVWGDVNNDGRLDFFVATTAACRYGDLYLAEKDGSFSMKTFDYGLWAAAAGNDAVWIDCNNDGKLDLATADRGFFRLYRNESLESGNYLVLLPENMHGSPANGAQLEIFAGGQRLAGREASSGRGQSMQVCGRVHFGLGDTEAVDSLKVRWPDGSRETFTDIPLNKLRRLKQGTSRRPEQNADQPELRAFPNPFRSGVSINFILPESGSVRLSLYTLSHQLITTLVNDVRPAGSYRLQWDAVDERSGSRLAAGVYLLRLHTDSGEALLRLVLED